MLTLTPETLVKVLEPGRMPVYGNKVPWKPEGEWTEVRGLLVWCRNGLHMVPLRYAWVHLYCACANPLMQDGEIYTVEYDHSEPFEVYYHPEQHLFPGVNEVVAQKARLLQRIPFSMAAFKRERYGSSDANLNLPNLHDHLVEYLQRTTA